MKKLVVGVASYEYMKSRSLAIAKGDYKPKRGEPKVWFRSIESAAKILSEKNQELLAIIVKNQPGSITELAELSGRGRTSVQRTIRTMARYGLVTLKKEEYGRVKPFFPYSDIVLNLTIRQENTDKWKTA